MIKLHLLFFSILVLIFACGTVPKTTYTKPREISVVGNYHHEASNFSFPSEIGSYKRLNVIQYDDNGVDVGAGYMDKDEKKPIQITVYIYPGPSVTSLGSPDDVIQGARTNLCERYFEQNKLQFLNGNKDMTVKSFNNSFLYLGKAKLPLREAIFASSARKIKSYHSTICPFQKEWSLKFRATSANSMEIEVELHSFAQELLNLQAKNPKL